MGMQPYCTDSAHRQRACLRNGLVLLLLTAAVLAIHGFHPWAEDGGLYASAIEYKLNPHLFPADTAFVLEPTRYSVFASFAAWLCRGTRLSVQHTLLLIYCFSTALMIVGMHGLSARMLRHAYARWTAVALLVALWTLPIAGTSLLLMDPYVTARSIAVPLVVLALVQVLDLSMKPSQDPWGWVRLSFLLVLALAFHVLMAGYGVLLCAVMWSVRQRRSGWFWAPVCAAGIASGACVQRVFGASDAAGRAAVLSRSYWFLSQWHWYEQVGLLAPLVFFAVTLRRKPDGCTPVCLRCCRAALGAGLLAITIALLFAHAGGDRFGVARLQPLRVFLLLYVLFLPVLVETIRALLLHTVRISAEHLRWALVVVPVAAAGAMLYVQHRVYAASGHIEFAKEQANAWQQAFLWVHEHTPENAVFAMDALYTSSPREDAQNFRPIAERSMLADYSKDGGEASIAPDLADAWLRGMEATRNLDRLPDAARTQTLRRLGATWVILDAHTQTMRPCPYRNAVVKVCQL